MKKWISRHPVISGILLVCALFGTLILGGVAYLAWEINRAVSTSQQSCLGTKAKEVYVWEYLPFDLPEQKGDLLPAFQDDRGMCDAAPLVLFQASPEWIADFSARYGLADTDQEMRATDESALLLTSLIKKRPQIRSLLDDASFKKLATPHGLLTINRYRHYDVNLAEAFVDKQKGYVLLRLFILGSGTDE